MTLNIFTEGICPKQLWNVFAMQIILCNFFPLCYTDYSFLIG